MNRQKNFQRPRIIFGAFLFAGLVPIVADAQTLTVDLPRDSRNAVVDTHAASESAIVISIPRENKLYLNGKHVQRDSLGAETNQLVKGRAEEQRIVYLAGGASVKYGFVVDVLIALRESDVGRIGLIVDSGEANTKSPLVLFINFPLPLKEDEDISKLKPNPLTLVATVASDRKLTLNQDSGPRPGQLCSNSAPDGLGTDPVRLERWLKCLFENRSSQRAYAVGMETRTDLPLAQRIEKTVFVKGARSLNYADVVRVIDAVKGAGAHPLSLQIDDLPE